MLVPVCWLGVNSYLCVDTELLPGSGGFDNQVNAKKEDIDNQSLTEAQKRVLIYAYRVVDAHPHDVLPLYCYGKVKWSGNQDCKFVIDDVLCVNKTGNRDMLAEFCILASTQVSPVLECFTSRMGLKFVAVDKETYTPMLFAIKDNSMVQTGVIEDLSLNLDYRDVTEFYYGITSLFLSEMQATRLTCKMDELNRHISLDLGRFSRGTAEKLNCGNALYKACFPPKNSSDIDSSFMEISRLSNYTDLADWMFVMAYLALCAYVVKDSGKLKWLTQTADLRRFYASVGVGRKESSEFEDALMLFGQGTDYPKLLVEKNRLTGIYLTQQIMKELKGSQVIGIGLNGFKTVSNGSLIKSRGIIYRLDGAVQFLKSPFGQQGINTNISSTHSGYGCDCNFILEPFSNWDSILGLIELGNFEPVHILIDIDRFAKVGKLSEFLVWFFESMRDGLEMLKFGVSELRIKLCKNLIELTDGIGVQECSQYTELIVLSYNSGVVHECSGMSKLGDSERRALKAQVVKAMVDSLRLERFTGGDVSVKVRLTTEKGGIGYTDYWRNASYFSEWMSATSKHIIANKQKVGYRRKFLQPVVMRAEEDFLNVCGLYGKFVSLLVSIGTVSNKVDKEATIQLLMCRGIEAIQNEFIRVTNYPVTAVTWDRLKVLNIDKFASGLRGILEDNDGVAHIKYKALDLSWLKAYADNLIVELCRGCGLYER